MSAAIPFCDILEAAGQLPLEDQETLIGILQRRIAHAGRERCAADVEGARQEFAAGRCRPATTDEIMREILE